MNFYIYPGIEKKQNLEVNILKLHSAIKIITKLDLKDLRKKHRHTKREITYIQYICFLIRREKMNESLNTIARYYLKDHTTILYGIKKIKNLIEVDKEVNYIYNMIVNVYNK